MIPGWAETIRSIKVVVPGLVSSVFLVNPPEHFPLILHGLLRDFPSIQATQGDSFLILMSFLGVIPLLDNPRSNFKEQRFNLWCQTRSSLSSRPQRSSVDHSLAMSSLVISAPTTYFSTSSTVVDMWGGLTVGVRRFYPAFRLSSWPKIRVFQVSPQGALLVHYSRVKNMGVSEP